MPVLAETGTPGVTTGEFAASMAKNKRYNDLNGVHLWVREGASEAGVRQAWSDAHAAGGGAVELMGSAYSAALIDSLLWELPGMSLLGQGSAATVITTSALGAFLKVNPNPDTVTQMGSVRGLTIRGTGAAGGIGVHTIDVGTLPAFDDVVIEGFTHASSVGFLQEQVDGVGTTEWSERASGLRLHLNNNTVGMRLKGGGGDANSFGYHRWLDLRLNLFANQIGIQFDENALAYNGIWNVLCNVGGDNAVFWDFLDNSGISGWGTVTGEQTSGTGLIGRRLAAGATWAMSGYYNVLGAVDSGSRFFPPMEIDGNGRTHHRYPELIGAVPAAGAGAGAPTPVLTANGGCNDIRGTILFGTGTSPNFGDQVTVTWNTPFVVPPVVTLTALGRPTSLLGPHLASATTTGMVIGLDNAPAASQAAGTYGVTYRVTG